MGSQVATAGPSATSPSGDAIGTAAEKLSTASYPFLKSVDWLSPIYLKPLPGVSAKESLKAIDKAIVMGSAMDGNALKAAAEAHHKAINSIDASGVTSAADYAAVNNALGHAVASVPSSVPNNLFSLADPLAAAGAAKAFYDFKDVVK